MTNESRSLSHYNRSPRCFAVAARVVIRTYGAKARRQALLTNGASLIGQMLRAALDRGIPVWTEAPLDDLVVEDGRVVGVRTVRDGKPVAVRARHGVLISAGGFAHNPEMREEYSGDQPNTAKWSIANPGDTGEALLTAIRLGAATDLMDEAWWLPEPAHRPLRPVDPRPGQAAAAHDHGRRRRQPVRQRVELLHGGRQGDVRPRQDRQGRAGLADLRRPLPQALRPPAIAAGALPEEAAARAAT